MAAVIAGSSWAVFAGEFGHHFAGRGRLYAFSHH